MCFWNDTHAHLSAELSLAGVLLAAPAAAGRYLVDDATTAPDGRCQGESWGRTLEHDPVEASTSPACTLLGVESSATGTRSGSEAATTWGVGTQWIAGDLDRDGRAAGLADGVVVARFPRQRTIGLNLSF